mmetsp:Transcript_62685/g.141480  ORF Transcript_62685/g.141480 Transcript_62685/m.141480 type:complete len:513 (+) Transcript_62685:71-1609(+)
MAQYAPLPEAPEGGTEAPPYWQKWLPEWSYDFWTHWESEECVEQAWREALEENPAATRGRVNLVHIAGKAIADIACVSVWLWVYALLNPLVTLAVTDCPDPSQPFAHFPAWVAAPFFPLWCWAMMSEVQALRKAVLPYAQLLAPFKTFGITLTYVQWYVVMLVISGMSKLDLCNNGLFLAKMVKTFSCQEKDAQVINVLWHRTISASIVADIPIFRNLACLFLIIWALQFIQILSAFGYGYPLSDQGPRSDAKRPVDPSFRSRLKRLVRRLEGEEDHNPIVYDMINAETKGYEVLCAKQLTWHADVLMHLSFASRMLTIVDKNIAWQLMRAREEYDLQKYERSFSIVEKMAERLVWRIVGYTFLERYLMLECQVSVFAISRALMPVDLPQWQRVDYQMLIMLLVSFASFLKTMYDHIDQLNMVRRTLAYLGNHNNHSAKCKKLRDEIFVSMSIYGLVGLLTIAGLTHCWVKLVMAFACRDSIWNSPVGLQGVDRWGCVEDVPEIVAKVRGPG